MTTHKPPAGWALAALVTCSLACNAPSLASEAARPTPTPPLLAPDQPTAAPGIPAPPAVDDEGWQQIINGMEYRLAGMPTDFGVIDVHLIRVTPGQADIRVHYAPQQPRLVSEWRSELGAALVVNGGFFQVNNATLGMLFVEGQMFGATFEGHGGMLTVDDGTFNVRSLAQFPYIGTETFDYAVQGRPMLAYPGGFPVEFDLSDEPSRRTAVAQDNIGRVTFIIVDFGAASLYDLRDWAASPEGLGAFVAFNLDGGGSTGLALDAPRLAFTEDSFTPVPVVIGVYPR